MRLHVDISSCRGTGPVFVNTSVAVANRWVAGAAATTTPHLAMSFFRPSSDLYCSASTSVYNLAIAGKREERQAARASLALRCHFVAPVSWRVAGKATPRASASVGVDLCSNNVTSVKKLLLAQGRGLGAGTAVF